MSDHSEGRVTALADAFKAGWHKADDANLPDRTRHGILAVLEHPELADLVAHKVHEALERAAEAVRMSEWPPRYVMGPQARRLCDPGPRVYCPMCGQPGAFQLDGGAIVHNDCEGEPR